jgi:hypothetical protein
MIARLFDDTHRGFYVDVGAAHRDLLSVTRHFYDRGWSGVNVEPTFCFYPLLCDARPRDINLDVLNYLSAPTITVPSTGLPLGCTLDIIQGGSQAASLAVASGMVYNNTNLHTGGQNSIMFMQVGNGANVYVGGSLAP